jgi:hypothetical protein
MKSTLSATLFLLFCLPTISKAAAYWLEVKGNGKVNQPMQIQVCYGFIDEYRVRHRDTGKELELTGAFRINIMDEKGQLTAIPIIKKADCWEGTFTPKQDGMYRIIGVNDSHPVVYRSKTGGKNVRPVDYLYSAYQVGDIGSPVFKPAQFLDLIISNKDDIVNIKAFNNMLPTKSKTKLRVFNPENWEKELETDEHGEAFFKTTMKGQYIIREDWDDATPGTYNGVSYVSTRYRCNYCLQVQ